MDATKEPVERSVRAATIADVIDRVLDKGLVINADIAISIASIELLGIRIRAVLASLETAARYGLQLPAGTSFENEAWQDAMAKKEDCPECGKRAPQAKLLSEGCAWCGWVPARLRKLAKAS